jgi:hypothetical protein
MVGRLSDCTAGALPPLAPFWALTDSAAAASAARAERLARTFSASGRKVSTSVNTEPASTTLRWKGCGRGRRGGQWLLRHARAGERNLVVGHGPHGALQRRGQRQEQWAQRAQELVQARAAQLEAVQKDLERAAAGREQADDRPPLQLVRPRHHLVRDLLVGGVHLQRALSVAVAAEAAGCHGEETGQVPRQEARRRHQVQLLHTHRRTACQRPA